MIVCEPAVSAASAMLAVPPLAHRGTVVHAVQHELHAAAVVEPARTAGGHRRREGHRLAVSGGIAEEVTVAVAPSWATTWLTAAEAALGAKLASPLV